MPEKKLWLMVEKLSLMKMVTVSLLPELVSLWQPMMEEGHCESLPTYKWSSKVASWSLGWRIRPACPRVWVERVRRVY